MMRFVVLGENMLSLLCFSGKIVGQNRVLGEIFYLKSHLLTTIFDDFIKNRRYKYRCMIFVVYNLVSIPRDLSILYRFPKTNTEMIR